MCTSAPGVGVVSALLLLAYAFLFATPATAAAAARPPAGRALFARDESLVSRDEQATELLDFCTANGVALLLLGWDGEGREAQAVRSFLDRAHARGLAVYALAGHPEWGAQAGEPGQPIGRDALNHVLRVLEHNRGNPPSGRFDGIVHEVDVRASAEYQAADADGRRGLLSSSVEIISACQRSVLHMARDLAYGAVVPDDLDEKYTRVWAERTEEGQQTRSLEAPTSEHLLQAVSLAVILTSAGTPPDAIAAVQDPVRRAGRLGRDFYVGLRLGAEHDGRSDGPPPVDQPTAVDALLRAIGLTFGQSPLYRGEAIDDYARYVALRAQP